MGLVGPPDAKTPDRSSGQASARRLLGRADYRLRGESAEDKDSFRSSGGWEPTAARSLSLRSLSRDTTLRRTGPHLGEWGSCRPPLELAGDRAESPRRLLERGVRGQLSRSRQT